MSKLTALQSAALAGKSIQLSGRGLPPSLTYLRLADVHAGKPLPTVSIQVLLQHLNAAGCFDAHRQCKTCLLDWCGGLRSAAALRLV